MLAVDYFPAFLDLNDRPCLIVGGGDIAARKARLLRAAGARLSIVSPETNAELSALVANGDAVHVAREFRHDDVEGHWLVVCATNNTRVQREVSAAAAAARVFCNSVDDSENSSYITPAIVDRGSIVVAISSGGAAPVLARRIRAKIEALLPASLARLASFAREWRGRVTERIPDVFHRRRFWESVLDGAIARQVERGSIDEAQRNMSRLLEKSDDGVSSQGEAWLVGAGPGDPELLTLRALHALQSADVILHDRLASAAVLEMARRDAERIAVGKRPGCRKNSQEEINELLVSLVASGKRVCRLKGGDPFIFGRGGEEAEALEAAGLPYTVIPGITAAAGCAAYAGIPLTHRDAAQSVVLLTAHGKESVDTLDWPSLARDRQTLAVYMAVHRFGDLMNRLIEHGRAADTPVAIIENGTTPKQRIIRGTLGQLTLLADAHQLQPPAMLIIGEVANRSRPDRIWPVQQQQRDYGAGVVESAIHKLANSE